MTYEHRGLRDLLEGKREKGEGWGVLGLREVKKLAWGD